MKKINSYIKKIIMSQLILGVLSLLLIFGAFFGFRTYYLSGIIRGIQILLPVFYAFPFIKKNINKDKKISLKVIINSLTIYVLSAAITNLLSTITIICQRIVNFDNDLLTTVFGFTNLNFLIVLLILIPISKALYKDIKSSRKDIYMSILIILCIEIIRNSFISNSINDINLYFKIKSIIEMIFSYFKVFISVLPAILIGVTSSKEKKDANPNITKSIIIFVITLVVYILCLNIPIEKLETSIDISQSKPNENYVEEYKYCIIPYITKSGVYYSAHNTNKCWDESFLYDNPKYKSVINYIDDNNLEIKNYVSNVKSIFNFRGHTNNLYYELDDKETIFELQKDGTSNVKLENVNPPTTESFDNYFLYEDYIQGEYKKLDLYSGEILKLDLDDQIDKVLFYYNNDVYYYSINEKYYRYNILSKDILEIKEEVIKVLLENLSSTLYSEYNNYIIKDDILYFIDYIYNKTTYEKKAYIYKYNLKNYNIDKYTFNYDDNAYSDDQLKPLGIYNNELYFALYSDEKNEVLIKSVNLNNIQTKDIINTGISKQFSQTDESYFQKEKIYNLLFNNIIFENNYIYYNDYKNDEGQIYRYNILNNTKEKINNDSNSVFIGIYEDYIYYLTTNYYNQTNSFYRIKNLQKEVILENDANDNSVERKPWDAKGNGFGFSYTSCIREKRNNITTDEYMGQEIVCAVYDYKMDNGSLPNTFEDIKPYIYNEVIFSSKYDILLNAKESPTKENTIYIAYNRGYQGEEENVISAWILNPDDKIGLSCVYGIE